MKVNVYYCRDCGQYFLVQDKHVRYNKIQLGVDCDVCGSKRGCFLIREVNLCSRNWVPADGFSWFAMDEEFMEFLSSSGCDADLEFDKWLERHKESFRELDMDAVRKAVENGE